MTLDLRRLPVHCHGMLLITARTHERQRVAPCMMLIHSLPCCELSICIAANPPTIAISDGFFFGRRTGCAHLRDIAKAVSGIQVFV